MGKFYAIVAILMLALCPAASAAEKEVLHSQKANYNSETLNKDYECTIVQYTDGTYAVKGIYGSEDALEFTINYESVIEGVPEIVLSNSYSAAAPYYYFHAGDYILCAYQQTGSGYTGWEGDTSEPGVWFYVYVYDKANNYLGAGFDYITWEKGEVTSVSLPSAVRTPSGDTVTLTGIRHQAGTTLPRGLYIRNGRKFVR